MGRSLTGQESASCIVPISAWQGKPGIKEGRFARAAVSEIALAKNFTHFAEFALEMPRELCTIFVIFPTYPV
jgi:hypothetical protein